MAYSAVCWQEPAQADADEDGGDGISPDQLGKVLGHATEFGASMYLPPSCDGSGDRLRRVSQHARLRNVLAEPFAQPLDADPCTGGQLVGFPADIAGRLAGHRAHRGGGVTGHLTHGCSSFSWPCLRPGPLLIVDAWHQY